MRVAVLGAVCFDEIFLLNGERREGYGGILYNAAALASIAGPDDVITPLSLVAEDHYDAVVAEFARLPGIDLSGLIPVPGHLTHVTLTWRSDTWRDERIVHAMPPFTPEVLERVLDCDAVHLNFINGTEMPLDTMRAFSAIYSGVISVDVHQIISTFDAEGRRNIVGFTQWRDWAPYMHVLQCNEFEMATMFPEPLDKRADYIDAALEVCAAGPDTVNVTMGPEGVISVYRRDGDCYLVDIAELPPVDVVDTTGCGDSYSAGWLVSRLRGADCVTAAAAGVVMAVENARHQGVVRLPDAEKRLANPRPYLPLFAGKPDDWPGVPL